MRSTPLNDGRFTVDTATLRGLAKGIRRALHTAFWPLTLFAATLTTAIIGALFTGTETGSVTGGVESLSANSSNFLSDFSTFLPFGFAFGAGMVSSVNPCGFAMLPAYLGMYLGDDDVAQKRPRFDTRLRRAMLVGCVVTIGFVVLFGIVGIAINAGARPLVGFFPWIGLAIGVLLAGIGAYMVSGGAIYNGFVERFSARIGTAEQRGVKGYFFFGLGYGTASLSCTLPIFLTVVGSTFTASTFFDSSLQFALYGLGMGLVILTLTISMAIFQGALVGKLRTALRYVQPVSSGLLLLAGAYIVFYWLTLGELLNNFL